MKRLKHLKCLSFFVFFSSIFFVYVNVFGVPKLPSGKIVEINGTKEQVQIIREQKRLPASVDAPLFVSDIAKTGDHSVIKISLKTLQDTNIDLFVFENSEFEVSQKMITPKKKSTIVNLSKGFLSVVAKKLPKNEDVRIQTPNAVVGVRGSFLSLLVSDMCEPGKSLKGKSCETETEEEDEEDDEEDEDDSEVEAPDEGDSGDEEEGDEEEEEDGEEGDKEAKEEGEETEEGDEETAESKRGSKPFAGTSILQAESDMEGGITLLASSQVAAESLEGGTIVPDGTMATITTKSEREREPGAAAEIPKLVSIAPASPTNASVTLEGVPSSFNPGQPLTLAAVAGGNVSTENSKAEMGAKEGAKEAATTTTANATSDTSVSSNASEGPFKGSCP